MFLLNFPMASYLISFMDRIPEVFKGIAKVSWIVFSVWQYFFSVSSNSLATFMRWFSLKLNTDAFALPLAALLPCPDFPTTLLSSVKTSSVEFKRTLHYINIKQIFHFWAQFIHISLLSFLSFHRRVTLIWNAIINHINKLTAFFTRSFSFM